MNNYLVEWHIDAEDVDDPEQAAMEAWDTLRREDSIANAFVVTDDHQMAVMVDLHEGTVTNPVWTPGLKQVAELAEWMEAHDWAFTEILAMIRKPSRYADEYSKMISDRAFDVVAREPEVIDPVEVTYHGLVSAECLSCGKVTTGATNLEMMNDLDPTCETCGRHHVRWTREDGTVVETSDDDR